MRTASGPFERIVGPSLTATLVASVRAVYAELPPPWGIAPDPTAADLLPRWLGLPARLARRARGPAASAMHSALGRLFLGLPQHLALRTWAIDRALEHGIAAGASQLVLLGAGLDNRARRLTDLGRLAVFEVDHPASLAYKERRLQAAGRARPAHVTPVPVDFENERLDEKLLAAGLSRTSRTFWIWEGVTIYLTPEAIAATLGAVSRCSSGGSRIALTYTRPGAVGGEALWRSARMMARLVGEPVRGAMDSAALEQALASTGFRLMSDESPQDWAPLAWPVVPAGLREWERLAVAEVRDEPEAAQARTGGSR
jgi:methyltransferase (TIGR00027 family)